MGLALLLLFKLISGGVSIPNPWRGFFHRQCTQFQVCSILKKTSHSAQKEAVLTPKICMFFFGFFVEDAQFCPSPWKYGKPMDDLTTGNLTEASELRNLKSMVWSDIKKKAVTVILSETQHRWFLTDTLTVLLRQARYFYKTDMILS